MSLERDVADMRQAAAVLNRINVLPWAQIMEDIAAAAEAAGSGPISMGEQMRWTPLVAHTADYARRIIDATPKLFPGEPVEPVVDLDAVTTDALIARADSTAHIDTLIADMEAHLADVPVDENRPADGAR